MFKQQALAAAAAALVGAAFSAPAAAQLSISADVQARLGALARTGDTAPGYDNTTANVDGLFALFMTATKDLKGGYNAGFNCVTVATTADGANAGFAGPALPVSHNWDKFFAGNDNWSNSQGGFSSYGDVLGDNKGVLCNDEVSGFLQTPFGKFSVGHIMNPMRLLYDVTTVNPVWGNQRAYYTVADVRGNALRYGHSMGPIGVELQLNTASDAKVAEPASKKGYALTGVVTYEVGDGTLFGLGYLTADGDFANKYVTAATPNKHTAFGGTAKTLLGPVSLGYTYMTGKNKPMPDFASTFGSDFVKETDHTFKLRYDIGSWNFQGFLSLTKTGFNTPAAWGAAYTVQVPGAFNGATFNRLKIDRQRIDLWALYNLGRDVSTYIRLDTVNKKYTTPDIAGFEASMRSTKLEGGWLMHF